jgi:Ca-activated chloride channel homolog
MEAAQTIFPPYWSRCLPGDLLTQMKKVANYYARLGLHIQATPEEIRRSYREAARRLHPDTNVEYGATEFFLEVQEAFDVLSNPDRRSAYDAELPADAREVPKVIISTHYSSPALQKTSQNQILYVLFDIKAAERDQQQASPPLNICLVVDSSTSMQGEAMDTVKSAAVELIQQLRDQDRLSLVAFSDKAQVLLPAAFRFSREQAISAVRMLRPQGGTEIFTGLSAAFSEVLHNRSPNSINHILLLTDGRTYGDEKDCHSLAEQATDSGIVISALGIGHKWNDVFLDSLTARTGGSSVFIASPQDIRHFLNEKIELLGRSYADRVFYDFEPGPGVSIHYALRTAPDVAVLDTSSPLQLGRVPCGSRLTVLVELLVSPTAVQEKQVLLTRGRLTMEIPSRAVPKYSWDISTACAVSGEPHNSSPPPQVIQAVSRMTLYRMQEKAQVDIQAGNIAEATRRLSHLATNLLSRGENQLAETVLGELDHLKKTQHLSEEGGKRIKYGTRALLLPASIELAGGTGVQGFQERER